MSAKGIHAVDDAGVVQSSMGYDPYGNPMGAYGAGFGYFGFTGEQTDDNGSVFLRARYYEPELGVFSALDPWEGTHNRAMSLNGYSWVEGNPVMNTDPSGHCVFAGIDTALCAYAGWELVAVGSVALYGVWVATGGPEATANASQSLWDNVCMPAWDAITSLFDNTSSVGSFNSTHTATWIDNIPDTFVGQGEWSSEIPRYYEDPPTGCSDARLAGIEPCNFDVFTRFDDAFTFLSDTVTSKRGVSIDDNFTFEDWEYSDTYNGGVHWNIPGTGGWAISDGLVASIRCCPCCDDSYGIPIYSWKCHLNIKFDQ